MDARPAWQCGECGTAHESLVRAEMCCMPEDEPQSKAENWMFGANKMVIEAIMEDYLYAE